MTDKTKNTTPAKRADINTLDVATIVQKRSMVPYLAAGGTKEDFMKEAGFTMQLIRKEPFLGKMDKQSILDAVTTIALTGLTLNPELKLAYLVPRKGRLYFTSSYMGKKEILMRGGEILDVWANLVYEGEEFKVVEGGNRSLTHIPDPFRTGERRILGGYWQAVLRNGQKPFGTMPLERILAIKAMSEAVKSKKGSPWDDNEEEMMRKTILNWAFKFLPKSGLSENVLKAMEVEARYDNEVFDDYVAHKIETEKDDFEDDSPPATEYYQDAEVVPEEDEPRAEYKATPPKAEKK